MAVVVPSPATSPVLLATMFTSLAPMFSNGCGNSISLETVTPSLVMRGEPNDFCKTTLRPRGPRVALTALANCERPAAISARASVSNFICLTDMEMLQKCWVLSWCVLSPGAPRLICTQHSAPSTQHFFVIQGRRGYPTPAG